MKKYVLGFAFNEYSGEVVLIRKNKPEWQKGLLNGVGGKVGDTIAYELSVDAMSREFFEETGVNVLWEQWTHVSTLTGEDFAVDIFATFIDTNTVQTMEDEEVVVMAADQVNRFNAIPNLEFLIPLAHLVLTTKHPYVHIEEVA